MYHLPWTATTSSNARKQTVKKKKAERQPLFITTSPQWGLRFFQTGALLPMTQSEVSTGIFLVKLKARGAGCTFHEGPAPRDCGWGLGGLGAIPKSQMIGAFIWEKGGHTLANQPPSQDCLWSHHTRKPHTQARAKAQKGTKSSRRARTETDSSLQQLLTRTTSKMSLKLPRNWDFNLKGEAGKIGMVVVSLLPLWFFYLSTHHLHAGLQGTEFT